MAAICKSTGGLSEQRNALNSSNGDGYLSSDGRRPGRRFHGGHRATENKISHARKSRAEGWPSGEVRIAALHPLAKRDHRTPARSSAPQALVAAGNTPAVQTAIRRHIHTHTSIEKERPGFHATRGDRALMNKTSMGHGLLMRATVARSRRGARGKPCSTMFRPPLVATGSGSGAAPAQSTSLSWARAFRATQRGKEHEQEVPRRRRADGNPDRQPL